MVNQIQKDNEKFESKEKIKIAISIGITVFFALVVLYRYGIRYQTNDDATLSNIAAGAYGDSLHMVYVNIIFSALLRPLYAMAQTNWYVIVQIIFVIISISVIIYLMFDKIGLFVGSIFGISLLTAFAGEIFYTFHYTECSFIILSAGLLLITDNLGEHNKRICLGIFLVLIGSMLRWSSFYAAGGLSSALLLYKFFCLDSKSKKNAVFTMIAMFAFVFGAKRVDIWAYKIDPAWNKFTEYNAVRTDYSDFKVLYLTDENPFEEYGITDVDYIMLNNWDFYDEEKFDIATLSEISSGHQEITLSELVINTLKQIKKMLTGKTYNYMFLATIIFSILRLRFRASILPLLGLYGVFGILMMYITYIIRFPSWVELGLIWTVTVFSFYCISNIKLNKQFVALSGAVIMFLTLYICTPYYLQLSSVSESYKEFIMLEQQYFDDMSKDKDNIYLLSTTSINTAAGFDVMNPHTDNYYSNIVAFGGWLSHAPHREQALAEYGLNRPLVDAVNNEHVFLDYHNISIVKEYVEQELGCEIYVLKTGQNPYAPYQLSTTEQYIQ